MPRPLPGTTPLKAMPWLTWAHRHPRPACANPLPLFAGMCQALGHTLSATYAITRRPSRRLQEHGICVVFLPSPRCQICYRQPGFSGHLSSSVNWKPGCTSTKPSCHAFLIEPDWSDAQHTCTVPHSERLPHIKVQELSTSPSNKIGPWSVPWTTWSPCTRDAKTRAPLLLFRTNVLTVKALSRTLCPASFTALWRPWIEASLQDLLPPRPTIMPKAPCWGLRTYAYKLPCCFPHYAATRRSTKHHLKPSMVHISSHTPSHLGPKSQGLAVPLIVKLLRYMHKHLAILNCKVEPRVGGICQVPLRPSRTCLYVLFGKPWPERIKSFVSSFCFMSPLRTYLDQADTRVPDPHASHLLEHKALNCNPMQRVSLFVCSPCCSTPARHALCLPHLTLLHVQDGSRCDRVCSSS